MLHKESKSTGERKQGLNEGRGKKKEKGPQKTKGEEGQGPTWPSCTHAAQEVGLLQPVVGAADVMDLKPQALHLEVKVHCEQF